MLQGLVVSVNSSDDELSRRRGVWKARRRVYQADPPLGHHSFVEPTFIEPFVLDTITLIFFLSKL